MVVFLHLKDIADRAGPRSVQSGFREEDTRWDILFDISISIAKDQTWGRGLSGFAQILFL